MPTNQISIISSVVLKDRFLCCVSLALGGNVVPETMVGDDQNGGRISACSYRSYLSYDELAPDSLLDDQLSLVSGRTSTTPGPNIALVTPNGTLYRLSDPPLPPHGAFANDRTTNIVPEGQAPIQDDDLSPGNTSADLDDVFVDEDQITSVNDSEMSSVSVFDFAVACLRRQPADKTAVVSKVYLYDHLAFPVSAPKIWNSLPPHILQSQTLDSFRRH